MISREKMEGKFYGEDYSGHRRHVCGMCEAHINEKVRNALQVKKVTSSHTKK